MSNILEREHNIARGDVMRSFLLRVDESVNIDELIAVIRSVYDSKKVELSHAPNCETKFGQLMKEAGKDGSFIERTMRCQRDFEYVDGEVLSEW